MRHLGPLLWVMRMGLLVVFALHIITALKLAAQNRAARPVAYSHQGTVQATYASRMMVFSGLLILFYVVYHIAHFTTGWIHAEHFHYLDADGKHDVHRMVVASFENPVISSIYIASMAMVCFHLKQAATAFPQTLGLVDEKKLKGWHKVGTLIAAVLFLGFTVIPAAVLAGVLQ